MTVVPHGAVEVEGREHAQHGCSGGKHDERCGASSKRPNCQRGKQQREHAADDVRMRSKESMCEQLGVPDVGSAEIWDWQPTALQRPDRRVVELLQYLTNVTVRSLRRHRADDLCKSHNKTYRGDDRRDCDAAVV